MDCQVENVLHVDGFKARLNAAKDVYTPRETFKEEELRAELVRRTVRPSTVDRTNGASTIENSPEEEPPEEDLGNETTADDKNPPKHLME